MKADTLMVLWHNKEPVFSVDFHPSGRFASSGADNEIKIWKLEKHEDGTVTLDFLANLKRHTKAVNVVRFSPDGNFLATGSDDGFIYIWKLNTSIPVLPDSMDKEVWSVAYTLRGKGQDVYDLAWSPNSSQFIVGSTDNSASVWNVKNAQCKHHFEHHNHYVQGVAWDPLGVYLLTFSSDRTLRAYVRKQPKNAKRAAKTVPLPPTPTPTSSSSSMAIDPSLSPDSTTSTTATSAPPSAPVTPAPTTPKKRAKKEKWIVAHMVNKREYPGLQQEKEKDDETNDSVKGKDKDCLQHKLFLDESVNTFFRRLTWSPEGSLLFLPTAMYRSTPTSPAINACYIFSRHNLNRPLLYIPSSKPVIAVRCHPTLFKLRPSTPNPSLASKDSSSDSTTPTPDSPAPVQSAPSSYIKLNYRIVFAIATVDSVVIYDTQHLQPIAYMGDMHYANMSDLTWSSDGLSLLMSSTDGYCSYATFTPGELGVPLDENEQPAAMRAAIAVRGETAIEDDDEPVAAPSSSVPVDITADSTQKPAVVDEVIGGFFGKRKESAASTTQDPPSTKPAEKKPRRIAPTFLGAIPK